MFRRCTQRMSAHAFSTLRTKAVPKAAWQWKSLATTIGVGTAVTVTTVGCGWFGGDAPAKPPPFDFKGVQKDVENLMGDDPTVGPLLVRLAWHEAGTWDCTKRDGSPNSASMRFHPECSHGANAGLQKARDLLEPIKKKHPNISYADLWSLASCIAISEMGGPKIVWRWGRTDAKGPEECAPDGRLPDAAQTQDHVRNVFYRMGFNDREIVALIGAHTLGHCHADRSGFVGPWTHDPIGFDNGFFTELVENDWIVNTSCKQLQFKDSKTGKLMMLPADVALLIDPEFRKVVNDFAKDEAKFHKDFACAYQKLMELGKHNLFTVA